MKISFKTKRLPQSNLHPLLFTEVCPGSWHSPAAAVHPPSLTCSKPLSVSTLHVHVGFVSLMPWKGRGISTFLHWKNTATPSSAANTSLHQCRQKLGVAHPAVAGFSLQTRMKTILQPSSSVRGSSVQLAGCSVFNTIRFSWLPKAFVPKEAYQSKLEVLPSSNFPW